MDAISYSHSVKQEKRIKKFNTNPDSNSGVLTQPRVIEAGETVTIKSGRQAILADTVIKGDLVIEAGADVFIPAGAGFGDLDQRIDTKLDKDFSSFTDKPTPVDTDNLVLQEVGGDLKKVSYKNLIKLPPNDTNVKTALNASGNAPIYACRAWVNFNGTGTVAIGASGNVSSITDNGIGRYRINFTTPMVDNKYSVCGSNIGSLTTYPATVGSNNISNTVNTTDIQTPKYDSVPVDFDTLSISVFR